VRDCSASTSWRGPPGGELGARRLQLGHEAGEAGVARAAGVLGPQAGQGALRGVLPLRALQLAGGEEPPERVATLEAHRPEVGDDAGRRHVPGEDVRARVREVGGVRRQALDERAQRGRRLPRVLRAGQRQLHPREVEEVGALGLRKPQRAGERVEDLRRGVDVAPLLQPRAPGDADPRELRELLAAQPRRAAPAADRSTSSASTS